MSKPLVTLGSAFAIAVALLLGPGSGAPAAANAPVAMPLFQQFDDTNPCTGIVQTITVTGTLYVHDNEGAVVVTAARNITTSAGFQGRGTSTLVVNEQFSRFSLRDTLASESGARMRAGFILVLDLATNTVKVFHGAVECVRE